MSCLPSPVRVKSRFMRHSFPNEYETMLARAAARVRALAPACDFGLWFITDLHVPSNAGRSGALLARLIGETGLGTVVSGGDIPEAFGTRADLDRSIARYRAEWVEAVERVGGAFFPVHGNHDLTIRASADIEDGFTYPAPRTRSLLLDTAAVRSRAVLCPDAPGACCYYADFPESRIRLVVADTHDTVRTDRPYWGVGDSLSDDQLRWLAGNALGGLPTGFDAVVAQHAPTAGVGATDAERERFAAWNAVLAAFRAHTRIDVAGEPLDFSGATGRVLAVLSGHHHAELQSCVAGTWHISEPCDAAYLDYIHRSLPWCPDLPEKRPGSPFEQTLDAVQFDRARSIAHFTRVGGGADRAIHLEPVSLAAGESRRFEASFLPAVSRWGAYDAGRASLRANPARLYDYFTDYFHNVGTISPDGVFTAREPGEAVVAALAPGGEKELFPVRVVPFGPSAGAKPNTAT